MSNLRKMIKHHEGLRLNLYNDSLGIPTIGYARNLRRGITHAEAEYLFENDLQTAKLNVAQVFPENLDLSENRYMALVDMMFNLGLTRFKTFKKMIEAIMEADFKRAAVEMLDSKWAVQVGSRAIELAKMMKEG